MYPAIFFFLYSTHFSCKVVEVELLFAANQKYYSITDLISGRRPMSTVISACHPADTTREIQYILVT